MALSFIERSLSWLDQQPKFQLLGLSLGLVALIGLLDYYIILDLGFSVFYLVPIAITTWGMNRRIGLFLCGISASLSMFMDHVAQHYPTAFFLIWNTGIWLGFFLTITYLIAALKVAYYKEQQLARLDGLTGASNHRSFMEILQIECDRARRHHHPLTLAYMDLDNFKRVNDRWGHAEGDRVLKLTVRAIQKTIRSSDELGRLGGDKFALLLPQTSYDQAQVVLSRLYGQLSNLRHTQGWDILGYSIGAITFNAVPTDPKAVLEQADRLMYTIKHSSKNRLECRLCEAQSSDSRS